MRTIPTLCLLTALVLAGTAQAELSVTLTINGDVDEIMAVLEQIKSMGPGFATRDGDDPLRMRMHSVAELPDETEAPPEDVPAPDPGLSLSVPMATPAAAPAGESVLLSVVVVDEKRLVDTLSATVVGTDMAFDLFDNGTRGDATPADGVWSVLVPVPPETPVGVYDVTFIAYDGAGIPITVGTETGEGTTLTATTVVEILAAAPTPEPAPEPAGPETEAPAAPAQ